MTGNTLDRPIGTGAKRHQIKALTITQTIHNTVRQSSAGELHEKLRERVNAMACCSTSTGVTARLLELAEDPDAGPHAYIEVVKADPTLSAKLLALANSSWFGVRHNVTSIDLAVTLLGTMTVRSLALSHWVASTHNDLRLSRAESRMFWQASMCKGVLAREVARLRDADNAETAFAFGMLQDLGVPLLYATSKDRQLAILEDVALDQAERLRKEREAFRMDHTELGRILAQKLGLPPLFADVIGFHHKPSGLTECLGSEAIRNAVGSAALLPHVLTTWNRRDAETLASAFETTGTAPDGAPAFLSTLQAEFDRLCCLFESQETVQIRLADLYQRAVATDGVTASAAPTDAS